MLAPSQDQGATRSLGLLADPARAAPLIVAVVGALTIAGAWFFELVIKLAGVQTPAQASWFE